MKKIMVVAVAVIAGLGVSAVIGGLGDDKSTEERIEGYVSGTDSREYVSSEGKFKATFPGLPTHSTENETVGSTKIRTETFTKSAGETEFTVAVSEFPPGTPFDLDGGVNGAAAAVDGKVESSTKVKVQNYDAVEFLISAPDNVFVKALLVKVQDRAYHLQVAALTNPPGGYDTFKASFQITP